MSDTVEFSLHEPTAFRADRSDDVARYVLLQREQILRRLVIMLGPHMVTAYGVDQLCIYSDRIADPLDAALQHVAHAQPRATSRSFTA